MVEATACLQEVPLFHREVEERHLGEEERHPEGEEQPPEGEEQHPEEVEQHPEGVEQHLEEVEEDQLQLAAVDLVPQTVVVMEVTEVTEVLIMTTLSRLYLPLYSELWDSYFSAYFYFVASPPWLLAAALWCLWPPQFFVDRLFNQYLRKSSCGGSSK